MSHEWEIVAVGAGVTYRGKTGPKLGLSPTSVTIRAGERVGIIGPNGAGKSTLMKMLAGQLRASTGSVVLKLTNIQKTLALGEDVPWSKAVFPYFRPDSVYLSEQVSALIGALGNEDRVLSFLYDVYSLAVGADGTVMSKAEVRERFRCLKRDFRVDAIAGEMSQGERAGFDYALRFALAPFYQMVFLDDPLKGLDAPKHKALRESITAAGFGFMVATSTATDFDTLAAKQYFIIRNHAIARTLSSTELLHWRVVKLKLEQWLTREHVVQCLRDLRVVGFLLEQEKKTCTVIVSTSERETLSAIVARLQGIPVEKYQSSDSRAECLSLFTDSQLELVDE